jgi:hypothetical protein
MSANEDEFNFRTDANDYADANDMEGEASPEEARASGGAPDPLPWEDPEQQTHVRPAPPDVTYAPRERPEEPAPAAQQEHNIAPSIMIGPSRSGKTTLLLAIGRACHLAEDADLELEFVPDENTGQLMKRAIERITNRQQGPPATRGKPEHYPFWIHVSDKPRSFWEPPLDADLYTVMSDGGGGYLLPPEDVSVESEQWRNELIASAKSAVSIIFCIDATAPESSILEKELPLLLSKITEPRIVDVKLTLRQRMQNWFHQHMNRFRRRPYPPLKTRRSKPCLNVDRFLLLLTQVDKLCYKMDDPARYASMINPVEQARELLGISLLNSIRSALKPGAVLAAGISSAWGFRSDGEPFADPDGTPVAVAGESGEDILRRWTPFGIRDALYFIATGRCRGTVKELARRDLELMHGVEPIPFTFRPSNEQAEV